MGTSKLPIVYGITGPATSDALIFFEELEKAAGKTAVCLNLESFAKETIYSFKYLDETTEFLGFFPYGELGGENPVLDVEKITETICASPAAYRKFLNFVAPRAKHALRELINKTTEPYIIIESPLLYQSEFYTMCTTVVLVTASPEDLLARSAIAPMSQEEMYSRLAYPGWETLAMEERLRSHMKRTFTLTDKTTNEDVRKWARTFWELETRLR
jgi:dephospho-CoA kinase